MNDIIIFVPSGSRVSHCCRFYIGVRRDVVKDVASVQDFHKQAS